MACATFRKVPQEDASAEMHDARVNVSTQEDDGVVNFCIPEHHAVENEEYQGAPPPAAALPPPLRPRPLACCLQALCANKCKTVGVGLLLVMLLGLGIYVGVLHSKGYALPGWPGGTPAESCLDAGCLWVGAQRVAAANTSVSPCDDFFQFACGGHRDSDPVLARNTQRNLTAAKLEEMLLDQPEGEEENSADKMLRRVYRSCLRDETSRQWAAGRLLEHLQQMGGWWLVDPWNPSSFDLQEALQYTSATLDVEPFFTIHGIHLSEDANLVEITPRPLMRLPDSEQGLKHFEEYVTSITKLYLRDMTNDAGKFAPEQIRRFVSDVLNMRRMLEIAGVPSEAEAIWLNDYTMFPANAALDLDWRLLAYAKLGVRERKTDLFSMKDYEVSAERVILLKSLVGPGEKRMLNSYIVWQILEDFIIAMPLEYQRVRETFLHQVGWGHEEDRRESCQLVLMHHLSEPLGSLYARHYSEAKSKDMMTEIAERMRTNFVYDIKKYPWMDDETREAAITKVYATEIQVEYPEALKSKTLIDRNYEGLPIYTGAMFIENYLAVKAFQRNITSRRLKDASTTYAVGHTFDADIQTQTDANVIGIPVLELPVFEASLPMHYNMASLGPLLAHSLDDIIRRFQGFWFRPDFESKRVLSMTSQENWLQLLEQSSCLDKLTSQASSQPSDDQDSLPKDRKEALITEIAAVRLAHKAYREWRVLKGDETEKSIPGIPLTPEQSLFMTYAQMKCPMKKETYGKISTPDRVNFVLSQVPEFAEAFGCGGSPMNPEDKCVLKFLQR